MGELVDSMDSGTDSNRATGVPSLEIVRPVTVYLAHAYAHRDVGTRVQELLTAAGIKVINPFDRPDQEAIDKEWPDLTLERCQSIVRGDLAKINEADTVVAIMHGSNMIGTCMEIYHNAVLNGRATFALVLDDAFKVHPWIRTLTRQHYTTESLVQDLLRWPNL